VQRIIHLGFGIDASSSSFFLPQKIRHKFSVLRNRLLVTKVATLHDIQSFIGKCNHLKLVFPASLLFTRACRLLIPTLTETAAVLPKDALDEISFWTFVDSFSQPLPWRLHQHLSLRLFTDASGFAWGAEVSLPSGPLVLRDYWTSSIMSHDICVKETLALFFALQSISEQIWDRRVDAFVDNEGLFHAWSGLKAASPQLNDVLRNIFLMMLEFNASLKLFWVPSAANSADAPSRLRSRADSCLSPRLRASVWEKFGPFSFDLMSIPSNVFRAPSGQSLPFFAPHHVPGASGINVFAQSSPSGLLYVFPPFIMISALLRLLGEWGGVEIVIILPNFPYKRPAWLHLLQPFVINRFVLSAPVEHDVLLLPSTSGFASNYLPLGFGLEAFRCSFPCVPARSLPLSPRFRVLLVADSMLRPLEGFKWPSPFEVFLFCFSGGKLQDILKNMFRLSARSSFSVCVFHGGVNDASRFSDDLFSSHFKSVCDFASSGISSFSSSSKIICSSICQTRSPSINIRVGVANSLLREAATALGWLFSSNDAIIFSDLSDEVHLNASGIAKLQRRLFYSMRCALSLPVGGFCQ
jgi:hypothetical protein